MSRSALARLEQVECPAFGARRAARAEQSGAEMLPIVFASGKGSNLFDVDGNRYVDLAAGFGALLLGHGATPVRPRGRGQAERLVQALGDVYSADVKIALLERLAALHPGVRPRVMLAQSGATPSPRRSRRRASRPASPASSRSRAPITASATRRSRRAASAPSYRAPFADQLNPHVAFAPYPAREADIDRALDGGRAARSRGDVGAVLVEPDPRPRRLRRAAAGFLGGLVEIAHRHGALVIADEIWTGLGRAGSMVRSAAAGASRPTSSASARASAGACPSPRASRRTT